VMVMTSDIVGVPYSGIELQLQCPQCGISLARLMEDEFPPEVGYTCASCGFQVVHANGIWKTLPAGRAARYEQFMREYQTVREAEGRGSASAEYYLALPYEDLSGCNRQQWAIRARTYQFLENRLLPGFEVPAGRELRILDLGAGNGWMSYRLTLRGHRAVAVDLLSSERDGLGAAKHYRQLLPRLFPCFQAELDRLPFGNQQFDLAIFNASFHYSEDYCQTLREAMRCVRAGGAVLIADTAWYTREESGQCMIAERRNLFNERFGFPSDGLASHEFLTDERLRTMEERCGIQWKAYSPFYGPRWALRPVLARVKGKREPSRFRIYVAEVKE
jgi:SAM-dependent methyltransferase